MGDWCGSVKRPLTKKKEVAGAERVLGKAFLARECHPAKIIKYFCYGEVFLLDKSPLMGDPSKIRFNSK